jgi:DNA-binding response OmpR family regulator
MLTALKEPFHRVKGIELGADDYLGKPFDLSELKARVNALLRRAKWTESSGETAKFSKKPITFEDFQLFTDTGKLLGPKGNCTLTIIEARLLEYFINNHSKVLDRGQILESVWNVSKQTQTRTLDTFVMRLRQHLDSVGGKPDQLESVRGRGYILLAKS